MARFRNNVQIAKEVPDKMARSDALLIKVSFKVSMFILFLEKEARNSPVEARMIPDQAGTERISLRKKIPSTASIIVSNFIRVRDTAKFLNRKRLISRNVASI